MGSRIYSDYFGIPENAFSITPDPRFLFMSERHCEALAHLRYGVMESGCFILLTGEVGTGKTTVCRALLEQLPENVDVALLLSPPRTWQELLLSIADELHVDISNRDASQHELVRVITRHLLENYGRGRRTVVIIDEAQNIPPGVLEQVRLLTNLETHTDKLLHVFLVGQPELRDLLTQQSLRQVAQRITARYHLDPLSITETEEYVGHRLRVAGCRQGLFSTDALRTLYQESMGTPRVINILCDRALLGAFANDKSQVTAKQIRQAARQWRGERQRAVFRTRNHLLAALTVAGIIGTATLGFGYMDGWQKSASLQDVRPIQASAANPAIQPSQITKSVGKQSRLLTSAPSNKPETVQRPSKSKVPAEARSSPLSTVTSTSETKDVAEVTGKAGEPAVAVTGKAPSILSGIGTIGPGSPPYAIHWLRQELDRIEGVVSRENGPLFDDPLRQRVKALQRRCGLADDGIAGPQTLNYMHLHYGTAVPLQAVISETALRAGL